MSPILKAGRILGAFLGSLLLMAVLVPSVRTKIRHEFGDNSRTVLSTTTANFGISGEQFKIVKVKTSEGLFLEFYKISQDGSSDLFQSIDIKDSRDGYLDYHGQASDLIVAQADGDKAQILVPSFDDNMIAHLNVFRFDPKAQRFLRDNL